MFQEKGGRKRLNTTIKRVNRNAQIIIVRDLNVRVGNKPIDKAMGKPREEALNSNEKR